MQKNDLLYTQYVSILKEELLPATGCTEPIAIALASAHARDALQGEVLRAEVRVCGNIIKNAKSVAVPGTGGLKGIKAAVGAGVIYGRAERALDVIGASTPEDAEATARFLQKTEIDVCAADTDKLLYIDVTLYSGEQRARAVIEDTHTNITLVERNGVSIYNGADCVCATETPRECLNVRDIYSFANSFDMDDLRSILQRQADYNLAIAEEGLTHGYGAGIGRVMRDFCKGDAATDAASLAAAGSDARMSGCEMPVIVVSGSGNQGMTASLPVISYALAEGVDNDTLLRALALSDIITIYQKTGIGRLSAYCGAVSAGCGAACGVAFLEGGDETCIEHTLVNAIAIASGVVCDGAKPSCAAKIATSVQAALLGYHMYLRGSEFRNGEGIVTKSTEKTVENVARMARVGMCSTDKEIISIMMESGD